MLSKFILPVVFIFVSLLTQAQQLKPGISGTINGPGAKPLQYVTVELFKKENAIAPLQSVYSNEKGMFILRDVDTGRYVLHITHTGYTDMKVDAQVTGESVVSLGDITLAAAPKEMQGVVVKARRPLIEQYDDKVVFNVENDPATKTETALDILRKTPFVTVDGEDNITVNGQTSFRVHLNGRETAMFAQNVKEALKGFSSTASISKRLIYSKPACGSAVAVVV